MKCESCGQREGTVSFYVGGVGTSLLCPECATSRSPNPERAKTFAERARRVDGSICPLCGRRKDLAIEMVVDGKSEVKTLCSKCLIEGGEEGAQAGDP